jgi:hypothetical protein
MRLVVSSARMKVKDSIEHILDKLSDIREELLSLERAIERIEASRRDSSGKPGPAPISLKIKTF